MPQSRSLGAIGLCLVVCAFAWSASVLADPPARVARLSYLAGTVSFDPAGTQDWVEAQANRPLTTGDSLWADQSSRAELNVGRAVFRIDSETSVTVTNLDDQTAQLQLAQGTMSVTVRRLMPDEVVEIDTPNLAFSITQPGSYRLNVAGDGSSTLATVRTGQANVTGEGRAYTISANASYSFSGTDLSNSTYYDVPAPDDFDRFVAGRESRFQHATAARYVSPDVIGYEDLDENGSWQQAEGYGAVWVPSHVDPDWAPYRDGHWAWVEPWGWTWVDAEPWGFAPFHYGRWVQVGPTWGWIPGPVAVAPVYAPALVAFVGGGIGVGVGVGVGWFPLGPREIYRPGYAVSPEYVRNVNVSNTNVTNTYVTTIVNNNTTVRYVNQSAPGVTAVSQSAFAGGQNAQRALVPVSRETIGRAPVTNIAAVTPTLHSVAPAAAARARPAPQIISRAVVARTPPPAAPVAFAAKQQQLAANPGRPLEPQAEASLRARAAPSAGQATRPVTVVNAPRPTAAGASSSPSRGATPPERPEVNRPSENQLRPAVPRPPTPVPSGPVPRPGVPAGQVPAQRPETPRPAENPLPAAQPTPRQELSRPVEPAAAPRPAPRPEPTAPVERAEPPRPAAPMQEARPAPPRPAPPPRPAGKEESRGDKRD